MPVPVPAALALPLVIALPLLLGTALAPLTARVSRAAAAWAAAVVTTGALALVGTQTAAVFAGEVPHASWPWVPDIGLDLALRLDGLALLFALLVLGIGLLVILYAHYYLSERDPAGKFFGLLMLFMAAMLGIVLADNLLLLVVFWELTSVSSFLLVGYWSDRAEARQGARMALAVTGAGGLALLAGCLVLGAIAGTFEISALAAARERVQADPLFPVALLLILAGAFTKSAQVPFHFWLPEAMAAPTPASAYLHSATMVKAGIFLLLRLYPVLGGNALFEYVVATVGLATMVFGAYVAIFKHDLKGLLAYSTISHLGLIVFLIGLDSPLSSVAAVFHVVNHATFKASLFMAAGIIDHECGTRDMRRINGLWRYMPYTATLAIVAASAMAGVPLLNGFLSKEMFFAEALELRDVGLLGTVAPFAATLGGAFGVAYSARFIHDVFWNGAPRGLPKTPHEPPRFMKTPVEILAVVCVVVGIAPAFTVAPLVALAARDVYGAPLPEFSIALWHGLNWPLAMSIIATAGGLALYWALARNYALHLHAPSGWTARLAFTRAIDALFALARRVTRVLDTGSLQRQIALLVAAAVVLAATPIAASGLATGARPLLPVPPLAVVAWLVLCVAALACVLLHRERLVAVVLIGAVGLVVAVAFIYLSAPGPRADAAVGRGRLDRAAADGARAPAAPLAAGVFGRTPAARRRPRGRGGHRARRRRVRGDDARPAVDLLVLHGERRRARRRCERGQRDPGRLPRVRHLRRDHRARDRRARCGGADDGHARAAPGDRSRGRAWDPQQFPLRSRRSALVLPFALAVSLYLLRRGHNLPGGGFIAGLVTAIALVLQYMALGQVRAPTRGSATLRAGRGHRPRAGLAHRRRRVAARPPFLTSAHGHPTVPLLGELPLATAALFDLGVYLMVVGATLLMLAALANASRRAPQSD